MVLFIVKVIVCGGWVGYIILDDGVFDFDIVMLNVKKEG